MRIPKEFFWASAQAGALFLCVIVVFTQPFLVKMASCSEILNPLSMKKTIAFLSILALALSVFSCAKDDASPSTESGSAGGYLLDSSGGSSGGSTPGSSKGNGSTTNGQIKFLYTTITGIALLLFTVTGFWLWYGPKRIKRKAASS